MKLDCCPMRASKLISLLNLQDKQKKNQNPTYCFSILQGFRASNITCNSVLNRIFDTAKKKMLTAFYVSDLCTDQLFFFCGSENRYRPRRDWKLRLKKAVCWILIFENLVTIILFECSVIPTSSIFALFSMLYFLYLLFLSLLFFCMCAAICCCCCRHHCCNVFTNF